jgi:hypothetical protein
VVLDGGLRQPHEGRCPRPAAPRGHLMSRSGARFLRRLSIMTDVGPLERLVRQPPVRATRPRHTNHQVTADAAAGPGRPGSSRPRG